MSEFFQWNQQNLGLDCEMDDEHKILINKMNLVYDAQAAGESYNKVTSLLEDLGAYTVEHFKSEEAYMEKIGFQGLATHKIIHQQLLKQFGEHMENYKKTQKLEESFFNFLKVWLTSHIKGIDAKYAGKHHAVA